MASDWPQSTARLVTFRAFLASDGKTPATGKTIAITISKNGATSFSNPNAGATNATEMASGFYKVTFDTTDTGTAGPFSWRGAEGTINDVGDNFDIVDANRGKLSALPAAAAEASGGLYTRGTGAGQLSQSANGELGVATLAKTVTTYTGNTPQTGDSYAIVNSGTHGNAALKTLIDAVDDLVDTEVGAIKTDTAAILVDTNELQTDWVDGGRLDLILDARASQTSVDDLPTNAELATSQASADDATLAAIAALNNLSAAQVNAEVDTALADIHLDHLLATTYDPASKPGAADALLNELVESDAGVARYTANALEQAPTGGSAPTAEAIADEVRVELATELGRIDATISSRASQASVDDLPTNAELATSQAAADDATLAAIATVQTSVDDLPTNAELATALGTADDAVLAALTSLSSTLTTAIDALPTNSELATALAAADDAVLAQIALVKAKTDSLTFTETGQVDANVQAINDVALAGTGVSGDTWRPA